MVRMARYGWGTWMPMPILVMVAGNIGVGKTPIVEEAGRRFGWDIHLRSETRKNPWIDRFYKNMDRWAFHSQIWFTIDEMREFQHRLQRVSSDVLLVDHCPGFETIEIFARNLADLGHLDENEWRMFRDLTSMWGDLVPPPDRLVYLCTSSVDPLLGRIQKQGLQSEKKVNTMYLERLETLYTNLVARFVQAPHVSINVDRIDPDEPDTFEGVLNILYDEVEAVRESILST